jgi:hypothetical protein
MTHNDLASENPGTAGPADVSGERADLLAMLGKARHFMRFPARGLTDEQARHRSTASELSIGGLIKHVTAVEEGWADFIVNGPSPSKDFAAMTEADFAARADEFRLLPGETLAGVLAGYERAAARTDELVTGLPDLDASHPLPTAPWYAPGERWSARRVLLHIATETAQHAGHADIIRESIDGTKSMG